MFRQLNLQLWMGLLLALKTAALTACIYGILLASLSPFTGGEFVIGIIPVVMGLAALLSFFGLLSSYFMVMTLRVWKAPLGENTEGYWIYSMAALTINIFLMVDFNREFLGQYLINLLVSIVVILIGNRMYLNSKKKLESLLK